MIDIRFRNSCNPIFAQSISSIEILPLSISVNRNKATINEDFPAPVRPTIPIFSEASVVKVTLLSTFLPLSASYRRQTLSKTILPWLKFSSFLLSSTFLIKSASEGNWPYSITRSTLVIRFSASADCLIPYCKAPVKNMQDVMATPTSPPKTSAGISKKLKTQQAK